MSVNVNDVKKNFELLTLKDQKTKYVSAARFNSYIKLVIRDIVNEQRALFESGKLSSDNLSELKEITQLVVDPTTGRLTKPSDYLFMDTFMKRAYFKNKSGDESSTIVEIEFVTDAQLAMRLSSEINPPTINRPIVVERDTYFQFYPYNTGIVTMSYIREPLIPFWNYTVSSNVEIYAATGGSATNPNAGVTAGDSTQFELPPQLSNDISKKVVEYFSMSIRQPDLMQASKSI